jgi:hypothetical protein
MSSGSKKWTYMEPGPDMEPVYVTMSEDEILATYYPWWSEELRRIGREHLISPKNCIEDWVVVNWAWRVNAEGETV